jgi:hypothetical protein
VQAISHSNIQDHTDAMWESSHRTNCSCFHMSTSTVSSGISITVIALAVKYSNDDTIAVQLGGYITLFSKG